MPSGYAGADHNQMIRKGRKRLAWQRYTKNQQKVKRQQLQDATPA
jgi:hypothetical protein